MEAHCHLTNCPHSADCVPAKPVIDPAGLVVGRDVRRRPGGRGCTVERISDDRNKVLVNDSGRSFWVNVSTLVSSWY